MLNWTESTGSKPFDTTSIFDMIMAHNSNFNGHDQQVCKVNHTPHRKIECVSAKSYYLLESTPSLGRPRAPSNGVRDVIERERQTEKEET